MNQREGFRFKQFTIHDDRCEMKVGTDGVLLGAWADIAGAKRILDIGTGSGLIALMLAQRTPATSIIDAVELSDNDAAQAQENVQRSPWPDRIRVHRCSIQDFESPVSYDLIVSNPPYFSSSLLPPSGSRALARHTLSLTHDDLLKSAIPLLETDGRLAVILPASEGDLFRKKANDLGLNVLRSLAFYTRPGKKQERLLLELSAMEVELVHQDIYLYSSGQEWSPDYRDLTAAFYL